MADLKWPQTIGVTGAEATVLVRAVARTLAFQRLRPYDDFGGISRATLLSAAPTEGRLRLTIQAFRVHTRPPCLE